jgi:5'(3')-deoxyribonucleotidase
MEGALDVIAELKKKYRLVIVSARFGTQIEDTHHWLEKHLPGVFDGIHFMEMWDEDKKTTKAKVCQEIGAGYLIDDNVEHCGLAAEEGIQALLFGDYGWNRAEDVHPGVVRVKDWHAVAAYFKGRS